MNMDSRFAKWTCLSVVCAVGLLAGCATNRVDWESRLGAYSYDEAVSELGPPEKEATLSDGTRVAEWLTYRSGGSTAVGYAGGFGYPGRFHPYYGPDYYGMYTTPVREFSIRLTFGADGTLTAWRKVSR